MRRGAVVPRRAGLVALLVLLGPAAPGRGGDPIPDVDVILEQLLGVVDSSRLVIAVEGANFDEVVLSGARRTLAGLAPESLPEGWTMTRDGTDLRLAGPARTTPTKLRLRPDGAVKELSYRVARDGTTLAHRERVVPRLAPPVPVRNSLSGLVYLPGTVSPGETLTFRTAEPLPPGRFTLAGEVVDEFDERAWTEALAELAQLRPELADSAAMLPPGGLTLLPTDGTSCAELGELAAALAAGLAGETTRFRVARVAAAAEGAAIRELRTANLRAHTPVSLASLMPSKHDLQKKPIGSIRGMAAPKAGGDPRGGAEGKPDRDLPLPAELLVAVSPGSSLETRHDTAKGSIRNLKAIAAPKTGGDPGGSPGEKPPQAVEEPASGWISLRDQPAAGIARSDEPGWGVVDQPDGGPEAVSLWSVEPAPGGADAAGDPGSQVPRLAALHLEPLAGDAAGCRVTTREPTDLELARSLIGGAKARMKAPPERGASKGANERPVYVAELPAGLDEETGLALRYHDRFGDLLVDVPRAAVRILPPRDGAAEAPRPCLTAATPYAQAGDAVCVCGSFPSPALGEALRIDELPLAPGSLLSTSASTVWLRLPATATPGRHILSGAAEAGFEPSCRATTQLVAIAGEIDSTRLLRGESVPMRLRIAGTPDRLPLRLTNRTPSIIALEGGDEQTVESSGGTPNLLERQVRALVRGDFNLEWSLASPPCPCATPSTGTP